MLKYDMVRKILVKNNEKKKMNGPKRNRETQTKQQRGARRRGCIPKKMGSGIVTGKTQAL